MATGTRRELAERTDQLSALQEHFEAVVASGVGRLVLIGGEAGVGKTALIAAFAERARADQVVWGACDPLFTTRPLAPFADMADAVGGELSVVTRGQVRPYEVAGALLAQLRQNAPAIAVLEDLHWADEATLDVLRLLGRRVESAPALVVVSYRDDGLGRDHPLRVVLGEMPHAESVARINLAPLSAAAVAALAGHRAVDADELYRKTGGNPFFVTEVLASDGGEIPGTVRDAVLARASRLSLQARRLLDAVAVVPQHTELWLLESIAKNDLAGLGECVAAGMLTQRERTVEFRHELARLAVEGSIPLDQALDLNRKTLRALMDASQAIAPARLAHHAEQAGDSAALWRFAREAAAQASAMSAHREAAAQLARALHVAAGAPAIERAQALQDYAQELLHLSRTDEAIVAQEKANQDFAAAGDRLREADGLRRLSRLYLCGVRGSEAGEPIRRAIAILEDLPPTRELGFAYAGLLMYHMNHSETGPAVEAGRRAIELAERFGDSETLLHALNSLGCIELMIGQPSGREKLLRSLDMADELGMDEHVGRAYLNLAAMGVDLHTYDGLLELIARGEDYCSEHGLELWRMWLLTSEARVRLDRGDWSGAAEIADIVLHGELGQLPRISALPVLGLVRARRGDPGVWPLLDEGRAMAAREGEVAGEVMISLARAEAAWLEGRVEAVADETEAAFLKATRLDAWWLMGDLACWRRRAGMREPVHPKLWDRNAAELDGDCARAASLWSGLGCEYEAALALAASEDEELLRQGLVKLQRLGARPAAGIVARKLRGLGATGLTRGPRATTHRNPALLTGRELEILQLLSAGMKNSAIAGRLFLSQKTVEHHVSAILRKLAVDNREQASSAASRLGLLG